MEKVNLYTDLAAGERFGRGDRFHWWLHLLPAWKFFSRFVLRGGFLDGHAGFIYAGLTAHATWLRALKMWERGRADYDAAAAEHHRAVHRLIDQVRSAVFVKAGEQDDAAVFPMSRARRIPRPDLGLPGPIRSSQ